MVMKASDLNEIIYQNTYNGYVDISALEVAINIYHNKYRYYGGSIISNKDYKIKTDLKKRLGTLRVSMFDHSKKYYNLNSKIDALFDQWHTWGYIRLGYGVSKKGMCIVMGINRPTLDSYIDEMTKCGHKPYMRHCNYMANTHKQIDMVSLMAFLIKKCEIQNGESSVKSYLDKIDIIQSKWEDDLTKCHF